MFDRGYLSEAQFERAKNQSLAHAYTPKRKMSDPRAIPNFPQTPNQPDLVCLAAPAASPQSPEDFVMKGAKHTLGTCPVRSADKKVVGARMNRYSKRAEQVMRVLVGTAHPKGDEYMASLINSKAGRGLFPDTSACIRKDSHLLHLAKNVQECIASVGHHSARIIIRFLSDGLPISFLKDEVGMTQKQINKRRVDRKNVENPLEHSLCMQNYSQGVKHSKIRDVEKSMLIDFFKSSTAVFSGTERRCVEYTLHDWEGKVRHTSRDHKQPS
jgi:hypothetical protein